ncbi:MAG TPA: response regulator transcription factor [Actinomycetota bacterium]|jgi:DNA-binding NarL/FixJ family response regulator
MGEAAAVLPTEPDAVAPARVLIVEDHAVIRGVVRLACENAYGLEVIGEVETGEAALEACFADDPDVIVLDLALPGELQGLDVARRIRAEGHPARILVLTGLSDEQTLFESMRVGVDGFLEKTAGVRFVAEALRRIARGERVFSRDQERAALAALGRLARQTREASGAKAHLTERELEILELVALGLSGKQVATRLRLSPRTVETHLAKLYRKLGAANRVQALARAASLGLIDLG